ncbi:retinol dehydrogenase [Actinoplanes ianthinogenes]|uniref:Retinol dehydrogenase n=1 Tax=Actinoplanes ianthinogenes TaxID=122358 RepID=A0ABN6CHC3_9ACTN|nr:SDR family NAD(P)-dependent oxidoreductase [Actinoplanes ianthinogenes]BCJ44956.1 retinol dehydrogenase [Actinoplanes ianthinogenes]GGR52754.1 retinol dehydrogenase [Actinoplanes ianthinogenes]
MRETVVVTGGSSGIGRATATALAARGATVVVVGRDTGRITAAAREITAATGNAAVEPIAADLSALGEVRRLAERIGERHPVLHALVNNAGVNNPRRRETADGLEETFAVNHLAPFLLTGLLTPLLRAAGAARVVTVTSSAFRMARIDFDDLQLRGAYRQHRAYNQSKLANILFTTELNRRLGGTGVRAFAVEPGFVRTGMVPPYPYRLFGFLRSEPESPARVIAALAAGDLPAAEATGVTLLSSAGRPIRLTGAAASPETAARLWTASSRLTAGDPLPVGP